MWGRAVRYRRPGGPGSCWPRSPGRTPAPSGPAPSWPSRPRSARRWSAAWSGPSSRSRCGCRLVVAIGLGGLPLLFAIAPALGRTTIVRRQPAVAAARGGRLPVPVRRRAGRTCGWPSATSRTSPTWCSGRSAEWATPTSLPAIVAVTLVTVGDRLLRAAVGPDHVRLPGRVPGGQPDLERRRDRRGVPVGGELPRRRRAGPQVRRRRALVPGRVRRRLPGAAALRRRAAAPLRARSPCPTSASCGWARVGCASWPPRS